MDKLEIVEFLLKEIKEEKELFNEYKNKIDLYSKDNPKTFYLFRFNKRNPSSSRIKDNCKKIRQLILEIGKEY